MTEAALYRWPPAAGFGRVVPKTKFYEHAGVRQNVRDRFVAEVQRITWAYKLADATIHLRGDSDVPEVQVFVLDAKAQDVSDDVLAAIDKAVPFPIIFEVNRHDREQIHIRMVATYKQCGRVKAQRASYFSTAWYPEDAPRAPLPPALDLPALYACLLAPMLPLAPRPGESLSVTADRVEQARKLEREIDTLKRRLRAEPQLNRRVDLRRKVRRCTDALAALTDPAMTTTEDASWTS